jgi:hypothetical protein
LVNASRRQNFSEIIKECIQKGEVNFWLILYLYYFSLGVAASEQEEFQQQAIEHSPGVPATATQNHAKIQEKC